MNWMPKVAAVVSSAVLVLGCAILLEAEAAAHCDTPGGPVIPEAKAALEKGDVTPILKWIKSDNEPEVRKAFASAVAVRGKGPEAKAMADRYFLETLVRLHRAGEGAPYTGIKDEPVEPIVAVADKALAAGSPDEMIRQLNEYMAGAIRAKFEKTKEAGRHKDASVDAGREYVDAYVTYMHYVEAIHNTIGAPASNEHAGHAEPAAAAHK
jgi:hypothetical protein